MNLARAATTSLWLTVGFGCRALHDDQETRPLPAPEPPPARVAPGRPSERARPSEPRPVRPREPETQPAREARAEPAAREVTEAQPAPSAESEPSPDALVPEPKLEERPPEPNADAQENQCRDACRKSLASCVSAPADAGNALATCKIAFDACQQGC